jgi:hypothetical protein
LIIAQHRTHRCEAGGTGTTEQTLNHRLGLIVCGVAGCDSRRPNSKRSVAQKTVAYSASSRLHAAIPHSQIPRIASGDSNRNLPGPRYLGHKIGIGSRIRSQRVIKVRDVERKLLHGSQLPEESKQA